MVVRPEKLTRKQESKGKGKMFQSRKSWKAWASKTKPAGVLGNGSSLMHSLASLLVLLLFC